jgi:membrane-associated phospholipid phosphatase
MRKRAKAFGCWWVLVGLLVAEGTVMAARPQEPATDGSAPNAQNDPKTQEQEKGKTEAVKDRSSDDQDTSKSSGYGLVDLGKDFLGDQKQIWTSPARLQFSDADWLVPVGGFAAGLFATDRDVSTHLSNDPKTISHYHTLSTAGLAALVGTAGGMWLLSYPAHREHWRETGFLAGEAAINSLVAVEALKYSLGRERPFQGDGSGPFFHGGASFPSEQVAAAWSVAGVIAHEYPGLLPKIAAYGLASLVSYSRIRARQHFPSDVFIGGMMGQLIAQDVYSRHFDPELGGGEWKPIRDFLRVDGNASPATLGSPYVPLDSWIYPALDRLAGLGLVDSGFAGLRPWTRGECARLVNEAADRGPSVSEESGEAAGLIEALQREFKPDNEAPDGDGSGAFRWESLYSRAENISGAPLTEGYTFGQTQINDFGRPYGQGFSSVNGFSAYANWGRWVAYVRGEEQTAPSIPAYSLATREAVQQIDNYPVLPPGTAQPSVQQFELLDAYVGLMLSNWEISFGKQSLWWGPGDGGPMMLSDNMAPINMFRVNRVTPLKLPSILGWLGPMRTEFFLGQLTGYQFVFSPAPIGFNGQLGQVLSPQPFIHGQKISFKPTRNFEFGVFRTTVYGGPGYPLTIHTLLRSLFSLTNERVTSTGGSAVKPGDRRSGVDFSYRLPYLRRWVSFYGDGFTDDEFSPIGYFDRSAWHAGLYFSQVPRLPKLDLRVEGVYTDNPLGGNLGDGFYYFNYTWRSGYTNNGDLIGSWIGREGQGAQAWTNYWFGARNRVQVNFRHEKVSQGFVPNGGTITDVGARGDYWVRPSLSLSASVQYERWLFPVIQLNAQRDVTALVEVSFQPEKLFRRSAAVTDETNWGNGGRP